MLGIDKLLKQVYMQCRSFGNVVKKEYIGTVRNHRITSEPYGNTSRQVLTFLLLRIDKEKNKPLDTIPVVMKCIEFEGFVNEDDEVKIEADWELGRVAEIKKLVNMTTPMKVQCSWLERDIEF
jgi:hypothetical protein